VSNFSSMGHHLVFSLYHEEPFCQGFPAVYFSGLDVKSLLVLTKNLVKARGGYVIVGYGIGAEFGHL